MLLNFFQVAWEMLFRNEFPSVKWTYHPTNGRTPIEDNCFLIGFNFSRARGFKQCEILHFAASICTAKWAYAPSNWRNTPPNERPPRSDYVQTGPVSRFSTYIGCPSNFKCREIRRRNLDVESHTKNDWSLAFVTGNNVCHRWIGAAACRWQGVKSDVRVTWRQLVLIRFLFATRSTRFV